MSDQQDSDEHRYSDSDHDDESQESSSDEATGNGLFDLEASEDDSVAAYEGQNELDYDDGEDPESFPNFMKLPLELREMVWKAFCPDLTAVARVYQIYLTDERRPRYLLPGPVLQDQTASMRTLLAVNRQARDMGLKSSPHTFSLSAGEIIRYHEEKDVIHVVTSPRSGDTRFQLGIQELHASPKNFAFSLNCLDEGFVDVCYLLPDARRIFILIDDIDLQDVPGEDYAWAVSDNVHHYHSETQEDGEAGLVTTIQQLICWPDVDKNRDFAQQYVDIGDAGQSSILKDAIRSCRDMLADPLDLSEELSQDYVTEEMRDEAISRLQKIEVWPMIQFNGDAGFHLFNDMKACDRPFDEWDSGSSDSDDTEDEYDSEGIDDDSIHDHLSTDDEDDLPGQLLTTSSPGHGTLGQLLDSSSETNDHLAAQFSSDEDDTGENQAGHADGSGSDDQEEGSRSRASRPKRRFVKSDSEDESATEAEEPRPAANHRGRAVLVDSEDEIDEGDEDALSRPAQGRHRRARAVPSDSEDEDEDDTPQPSRATLNRRARALPAESADDDDGSESREGLANRQEASSSDENNSSEESSSGEEGDDEPAPPKRLSLAQRLRIEAQRERSGRLDDEDSDADADGNSQNATFDDEGDGDGIADEYSSEDGESEEEF